MKDFLKEARLAVTVCDRKGDVVYQNDDSVKVNGTAMGRNLQNCHNPASWEQITEMLRNGSSNAYTIEKRGVRKLIFQTPWFDRGEVNGLLEFSIVLPDNMPHKVRG